MKAIAKDPAERFSTAEEMKSKITSILNDNNASTPNQKNNMDYGDTMVINKADFKDTEIKKQNGKKSKNDNDYLTYSNGTGTPTWVKWLISIILGLILITTGFFIFYRNYMDVPIVEVPDMVGMDIEEARKEASQVGLHLDKQNDGVHHPEVPVDHIISQYPLGGERVRQTRDISVTISLGPAVLTAPDLTGLTVREAEVIIDNQQLSLGDIEKAYSDVVAEGKIISQSPEPGIEIGVENKIDIIVSKGPEPIMIEVPNVVGLNREDAVELIENTGFTIGEITEEQTRRFLSDQVAGQEYDPGSEIAQGSKIDLTISTGLINRENAEIHKGYTMKYYVPSGTWEQNVEIILIDNNGRDTIYQGDHHPGDYITVYFNSVGPTRYEIFINDRLDEKGKVTD
ncbi:MAG: PASTA domain-containing protein [Halanaerobiales bacterium]